MRLSKELQFGKAGEYLVCADLILKGFVAFPSEQGLPYDVLMQNGNKLFRIQVKSTTSPRTVIQRAKESKAYIFNVKRHGKNNKTRYENKEVDMFALVCLDTKKVGYLLNEEMPNTLNLRVDSMRGSYYDEKGISNHIEVKKLKGIMSASEISIKLGLNNTTVYRMLKDEFSPYISKARYFSDIERQTDWFHKI